VIRKKYRVCIGNRIAAPELEAVSVVGPLCTPLDIQADKLALSPASLGDLMVGFQSGAYGFFGQPEGFPGPPLPA